MPTKLITPGGPPVFTGVTPATINKSEGKTQPATKDVVRLVTLGQWDNFIKRCYSSKAMAHSIDSFIPTLMQRELIDLHEGKKVFDERVDEARRAREAHQPVAHTKAIYFGSLKETLANHKLYRDMVDAPGLSPNGRVFVGVVSQLLNQKATGIISKDEATALFSHLLTPENTHINSAEDGKRRAMVPVLESFFARLIVSHRPGWLETLPVLEYHRADIERYPSDTRIEVHPGHLEIIWRANKTNKKNTNYIYRPLEGEGVAAWAQVRPPAAPAASRPPPIPPRPAASVPPKAPQIPRHPEKPREAEWNALWSGPQSAAEGKGLSPAPTQPPRASSADATKPAGRSGPKTPRRGTR